MSSILLPLKLSSQPALPPCTPRTQAPVHKDSLPSYEASGVRSEKHDHIRDVFGLTDASEWCVVDGRFEALRMLIHVCPGERCLYDTWSDRVDGRPSRSPLDRQATHPAREPR